MFFISQYVAGLAGNEEIVFFLLGVVLVLAELLFFPGVLFLAVPGIALMLGSLFCAMVDFWPEGAGKITGEMFIEPTVDLIFGLSIAVIGAFLLARLLKGSAVENALVLSSAVGDSVESKGADSGEEDAGGEFPATGTSGIA